MSEEKGILSRITESLSGVGGAIKSAVGAAREIQNLTVDYAVKEKTHILLDKLMDVQMQQMSLQELLIAAKEKIVELENEKVKQENWAAEAASYELYQPMRGTLVYRSKLSADTDQSPVYICPNCYEQKRKSILQAEGLVIKPGLGRAVNMVCSHCRVSYLFNRNALEARLPAEDENPGKAITDYDPYNQ
ncbi:TPA: hypothetical protein N7B85_001128 [Escherichia coli]|uniref:Uncharacterized protein n=3 Tax=Enterobacteriaceae TaxID=543 RepID=A0A244BMY7_ECOLX|nr:hypothetical protein [Escherichia coli]EGK3941502.1 hypothetical protein [Escherichia coli]EIE8787982.1 hypothetical protein [Escherichia coli]EJM1488589.1 hypothetical protein [Escherichia coli]EKJ6343780.1 hypothetical protein [Escherichia coli]EKJ6370622.1 hypothetical protein [Escherichia coli]